MKYLTFSKTSRLLSNRQFKAVLDRRRRARDRVLTLYMAENTCEHSRLGVSVGKSCGNAVARNRLKRLLREAFRQSRDRIPTQYDYVLMISPSTAKRLKQPDNKREMLASLTLLRIQNSFLALIETVLGSAPEKRGPDPSVPGAGK